MGVGQVAGGAVTRGGWWCEAGTAGRGRDEVGAAMATGKAF